MKSRVYQRNDFWHQSLVVLAFTIMNIFDRKLKPIYAGQHQIETHLGLSEFVSDSGLIRSIACSTTTTIQTHRGSGDVYTRKIKKSVLQMMVR